MTDLTPYKPAPSEGAADPASDPRRAHLHLALIVLGVLFLNLALAASYLVAWHAPEAKELPIAIAGPFTVVDTLADTLETESDGAFLIRRLYDENAAREALENQEIYGALVIGEEGDKVLVASAQNASLARSLPDTFAPLSAAHGASATTEDIAPLAEGDKTGYGLFYIAFSWVFGGYILATALNIARAESGRHSRRQALWRVGLFSVYSLIAASATAWIATGPVDVLDTDLFWQATFLGAAVILATSLFSSAAIALFGPVGVGALIFLFVALGNPASGGTVPVPLSGAGPWHLLAPVLPTGLAVSALRSVAYFGDAHLGRFLAGLAAYGAVGAALLLAIGRPHSAVDGMRDARA